MGYLAAMTSTTTPTATQLWIRKDQLATTQWQMQTDSPLIDGQVRLRIEHFALTSNNITYAAFGDAMNYWRFYPTGDDAWGVIPVWGFAIVTESANVAVPVGERVYGYFPMASSVVMTPVKVSPNGWSDGALHRAELHPVYNQLTRTATDPFYSADTEDVQALLRPLFITSWLIDDFLADNDFFGASVMLLSSASSKTAYGTAFQLAQRRGIEVVGLTSPGNVAFCESLGCYSRVLTYDQLDAVPSDSGCIYVDFAGNADLRRAIHTRFINLKHSSSIGGTHVEHLGGGKDLPGPRATLFFAPAQIKKRATEWGPAGLNERLVKAWQAFSTTVRQPGAPWLVMQTHSGRAQVEAAYATVLAGRGDPRLGHMLTINAASD